LVLNSTGSYNTALGDQSLQGNTTASNNTAVGYASLFTNSTGTSNTAVGFQSLASNTTANSNTAVGYQAGYSNTTGAGNHIFGKEAGYGITTGSANTAVGWLALQNTTTASDNTAVGAFALITNTTGASNVAVGREALNANTTASNNTAVGYQAGYTNTTGAQSTYIGNQAGYSATTGTYNAFLGYASGVNITTGSKNTIIGSYNGNQGSLDIRTASNYIVLSDGDGNPLVSTADNQTVALEGAVPNSGTGITFPATQSASSNANTLDDYEEGSWTPGFGTGWSTAPTIATSALYVKIGKQVTVTVYLQNGISTASALITGLPFQVGVESSMTGFSGTTSTAPLMTGVTQSGTSQIRSIPAATMTSLYWTVSTTYFV